MFEAFQERPVYWDNAPFHRSPCLSRGLPDKNGRRPDWIASWQRVARELLTIDDAIAYAKRILAQRPGCPVEIRECGLGRNKRVAQVSRDALGRTWCDSFDDHGLI